MKEVEKEQEGVKSAKENIVSYTLIFMAVFAFVIIVIDALVKKFG